MRLPPQTRIHLARFAFVAAAVLSLTMALLPRDPALPRFQNSDKFEHILAFAVMAILGVMGWPRASLWLVLLALALFGGGIEILQAIPAIHRDSQFADWLADIAATGLVVSAIAFIRARWPLA